MKIRKGMQLLWSSVVIIALAGCATVEVRHQTSPGFRDGVERTFRVVGPTLGDSKSIAEEGTAVLHDELVAKGFAPSSNPELVVSWKVLVDDDFNGAFSTQSAMNAGAATADLPVDPVAQQELSTSKTLVVFVQNAETLEVEWVGWAQRDVTESEFAAATLSSLRKVSARLPSRAGPAQTAALIRDGDPAEF